MTATVTYIDRAVAVMAPSWPTEPLTGTDPVVLTAAEVQAAAALMETTTPVALGLSEQQTRALDWATRDVGDLMYAVDDPQSCFGPVLRIRRRGPDAPASWLPLSQLPEALGYAVQLLARQVHDLPAVRATFAGTTASVTRRHCGPSALRSSAPPTYRQARRRPPAITCSGSP